MHLASQGRGSRGIHARRDSLFPLLGGLDSHTCSARGEQLLCVAGRKEGDGQILVFPFFYPQHKNFLEQ